MRYAIVANPEKGECIHLADEIRRKMDVVLDENTAKALGQEGLPLEDIDVDVIITLGGDGTILLTLQRARGKILGVNMGVLGFLTEIEPSEIWEAIERIERGEYIVDRRMKMAVYHNSTRLYDCVNEAVLHTSEIAKLRNYHIFFNNEPMDEIRADGLIISTPTGSTSYALSAGGPVVHPGIEGFVIVPIAPFKFTLRSAVLPVGEIRVEVGNRENLLVLDGQHYEKVHPGDEIVVRKSENFAEFIRFESNFFSRIKSRT